ncbi:FtsX-like permease family protein [Kribbella sp. CA-294648]|uniref:FtsX-like permease family protein n=1 Tax=Kribbella sp. CA-294648 TaxID=3239948 RepID=UPI003D89FB9F
MNLATQLQLIRPRSATDRSRFRLLVLTTVLAGAFLLAAWRIKRLGFDGEFRSQQYSNFIREDGIRSGVALAALLLAVASCLLAYQALRLGTAARDRRLAAFRLAGATPRQVRGLGAVEAGVAGLAGGILAGPLYLVLVLAIQLLPRTARMLPPPNAVDLATWPIVTVVLAAAATLVGGLLGRGVVSDSQVKQPPRPARATVIVVVAAGSWLVGSLLDSQGASYFAFFVLPAISMLIICLALPTAVLAWQGRRLAGSANPLKVLAGGRLLRTVQPLGRMLGLLVFCGVALGFVAGMAVEGFQADIYNEPSTFQLTGLAFAAGAALFVALIAGVALLAGTADDLLDQRRQLAALNVLGVGEAELRASVRYQLTSCITPAVTGGLVVGAFFTFDRTSRQFYAADRSSTLPMLIAAVAVGAGITWLVANAAAYLLRRQVHEAVAAENLRST